MIKFVLIDATNGAKTSSGEILTPTKLALIADAVQLQADRDYGEGQVNVRADTPENIQPGEWVMSIQPTLPGAPGAIAYHDVNGKGVPILFDAITLSDTLIRQGNSLSVAITHEILETLGNPGCNLWADQLTGKQNARERCDAVEMQSYSVVVKDVDGDFGPAGGNVDVYVSNFVLDTFFTPNAEGPYDFMTAAGLNNPSPPPAPFQTAPGDGGNYQIVETAGSDETQVTAKRYQEGKSSRQEKRDHWSSRTSRILGRRPPQITQP